MRRMLLLLTVSAMMAMIAVLPSVASAHTMSVGKAKQVSLLYVKRQVPGAAAYGTGQCIRVSPHGFRCTIAVQDGNGRTCANRVLARYVSARSYRIRVRELGNAVCDS